jgi:NAD(P)-dependent dehydrogenase (short-subunit alcohol dehydrogenase family)
MSNTIVLITGASGLGYATAQALLLDNEKRYTILITSRSIERAQQAAEKLNSDESLKGGFANGSEVVPFELDITKDEDIEKLRRDVEGRYGKLDVLVNNAGELASSLQSWYHSAVLISGINLDGNNISSKMSMREKFNVTFDTNVASVHVLTEAFIVLLLKSSSPRIVFVSSSVSSLELQSTAPWPLNQSPAAGWPKKEGWTAPTYRTSKTAMNMMIAEWRRVLKNDNIVIHLLCPGLLATELGGAGQEAMKAMGAAEPIIGGKLIKSVIEGERDGDLGKLLQLESTVPW